MRQGPPERNIGAHRIKADPRLAGFTRRLAASEPFLFGLRELARFGQALAAVACSLGRSRREQAPLAKAGASSRTPKGLA